MAEKSAKLNFPTCAHRTYKFSCRGIEEEDGTVYKAKNVLQRKVDRELDPTTTLPIERCHGLKITGWFLTMS